MSIYSTLAGFEKSLNLFGYIPLVSTMTGCVRTVYGKVEIITGLGISILSAVGGYNKQIDRGFELALHGVVNIGRGVVEVVPLIGNFLCFFHDLTNNRFEYKALQEKPHRTYIYVQLNPHTGKDRSLAQFSPQVQ